MNEIVCQELHQAVNKLPRYTFPIDKDKIYKNGIYILFERNEFGHGVDRIVRIGTHRGDNNLYNRLKEHFINENKDRSIFRKNIGRAILNKKKDKFLSLWEIDMQERYNRLKYMNAEVKEKTDIMEKEVTEYIQKNLSFSVIEVENKADRLYFESKLISTVSHCKSCCASEKWLGKYSPKEKIVSSGLWLVNELYKEPFSPEELNTFIKNNIIPNL